MKSKTELIKEYLQKVKSANNELTKKEHFKDLLHRLYHGEKEIEAIIDAISSGSERTVLNIPRYNRKHKGSIVHTRKPPQQELSAIHLGRLRVAIKKHLAKEMGEIDGLVKKLIV